MKRAVFCWTAAVLLILMAGCVPAPVVIEKPEVVAPAEIAPVEAPPPERDPCLSEERELLLAGVRLLDLPDQPDPALARPVFVSLTQLYPEGQWRPAADAFIRLIDEREAAREANRRDRLLADLARTEKEKALRENEVLKKTVREMTERIEKLQTEAWALVKDKEQLKEDLQKLKALEVELEKRERMLR